MVRRRSFNIALTFILLLYLQTLEAKKSRRIRCPIGFEVAYSKYDDDDPICYQIEGPQIFSDKFENCSGNLFTIKRYQRLNFTKPELKIWTDYKSLYAGGPFIDWSFSDHTGDILETTYEVNRDPPYRVDEELCVVMDPVMNFTAVRCDEKHSRYCFVKGYYDDIDSMSDDGCEGLTNGWRFESPMPTCLAVVSGEGGGSVRATWGQAQRLCEKRGGSLLNRGWIYSNNPFFRSPSAYPAYPLGIIMDWDSNTMRYDTRSDQSEIPYDDWSRRLEGRQNSTSLGAISSDSWYLVNSSYIFFDIICEKPFYLRHVELDVIVDPENKIILTVNETIDSDDIYCFTDSSRFFPQKVKKIYQGSNTYILKPIEDGYYWCTHSDSKNFYISESNKVLYIKVKEATTNLYAIKIRLFEEYTLDKIGKLLEHAWKRKIEEYVYFSTNYMKLYGIPTSYTNETIMQFRNTHPGLDAYGKDVIQKMKLKRLFLDARSALLHVELHPDMKSARPGQWENMIVEFMHPVYYCEKDLVLGETRTSSDCNMYRCIGDFNNGAQLIITSQGTCYTPASASVTIEVPTATARVTHPSLDISNGPNIFQDDDSDSSEEELSSAARVRMSTHIDHTEPTTHSKPTTTENTTTTTTTTENNTIVEQTTEGDGNSTTIREITTTDNDDSSSNEETVENQTVTEEGTTYNTDTVSVWPPRPPPPSTVHPVITNTPTPFPTTSTTAAPVTVIPEEQLQQVLDDLQTLINNGSEVMVEDLANTFNQIDGLLADTEQLEIPGNLLHLLDEVGGQINLNGLSDVAAVRSNVAFLIADARSDTPVKGLRIAARDTDGFTDNAFEIIREEINSSQLSTGESEVVVALPDSVSTTHRRISFVVFRNDRAFQSDSRLYMVNSRILSINVENVTQFEDGEVVDIHLTPLANVSEETQMRSCAYWYFLPDGSGYWSQEGCTFIRATEEGTLDTCRCDHLTHFAEVLVPRTDFSEENETALEILSIIGCCLSITGLLLVGLTALMFRSWRRDFSNKIWLQLCASILILSVTFLVIAFAKFQEYSVWCMVVGVLLHYAVLASFCWMVVAGVVSYRRLVKVFARDGTHKLLRAAVFAWGAPAAVVGVLLAASPLAYSGVFDSTHETVSFCYPSGLAMWLAVYAPIALMVVTNWTLFILIVRSVFASRRIQRHGDSNEALRCASVSCLLVFLFGLPWIFGLFAFNIVAAYFFTILASFQGFVLFLFFVLGNKKTRDLWLNKLKIKQTRKVPVTSSTYTNRSTNAQGWRNPQPPNSIEAKVSKPRSLASSDDSRFS